MNDESDFNPHFHSFREKQPRDNQIASARFWFSLLLICKYMFILLSLMDKRPSALPYPPPPVNTIA